MRLFKKKDNEVEIDDTEVSLLIESFQSQIDSLLHEKQEEIMKIDKDIKEVIQGMNIKKQQVVEQYVKKIDKYQQLITKIRRDSDKNVEGDTNEIDTSKR